VSPRLRAWLLILLIAALSGAAVGGAAWYRARAVGPAALLKHLPRSGALILYVDFAALRRAGILGAMQAPAATEDPEYRDFVRGTDFNYSRDLDTALAAFTPGGRFLLLRGRFDWGSLRSYAQSEKGECRNTLCRMQGSTADRHISFFPLQSNLMALAISADDSAAVRMQESVEGSMPEIPDAPVWFSIPPVLLRSEDLPAGAQPFARTLEHAESVVLSLTPEGKQVAARMNVRCRTNQDAAELTSELSKATALLRNMIERERHIPNPADLSGVLSSGAFLSADARVMGYWRIDQAFFDNLLSEPRM
jgi:hypothetical protein